MSARLLMRAAVLVACTTGLSGCVVGAVVGTAVDVGVEVVKIPFKVGKGVYDAVKDDDEPKKN
ncbi:NF038104 family lipoprotein [Zoogloea dura]|uniref:Lipoprotein n=1 Tax=Zoogloea dura TaxID=2728840 RepID=A0A848G175_9RHOO|nr:NF038104 family lipoprotein [Zoogloea dura]NML24836.1 hypothetical protein [Zoogloea dura]